MSAPRGLSPEEAALWAKLAQTVRPLDPLRSGDAKLAKAGSQAVAPKASEPAGKSTAALHQPVAGLSPPKAADRGKTGLDSHWERRLARASSEPDFTLDLHGHNLDQAWHRLDAGLVQAKAMGARLVLVVTGKSRPVEAADRGARRGAIRAKILDWLAAGQHASDIAAVRNAHRRHGGNGALYLVLKRPRQNTR